MKAYDNKSVLIKRLGTANSDTDTDTDLIVCIVTRQKTDQQQGRFATLFATDICTQHSYYFDSDTMMPHTDQMLAHPAENNQRSKYRNDEHF
ncbi:MAG: hypothetical protein P8L85_12870 [Rubripirellula sp.]|nr:hypothetical protein [Rubripirellula sp.]